MKAENFARGLVGALAILCLASAAHAAGFESLSLSPKSLALGQAMTTNQDYTSMYYNPSLLTRWTSSGGSITVGASVILTDLEYQQLPQPGQVNLATTVAANNPRNFIYNVAYTDNFGLDRWAFGIGLMAPYSSSTGWGDSSEYRHITLENKFESYFYMASVAFNPIPKKMGIGVTAAYVTSYYKYRSLVDLEPFARDQTGGDQDREEQVREALILSRFGFDYRDEGAFTFIVGAWGQVLDNLRIAASYQHETELEMEGDIFRRQFQSPEVSVITNDELFGATTNDLFREEEGGLETSLPTTFRIGANWAPGRLVAISADVTYTMWEDLEESTFVNPESMLANSLTSGEISAFNAARFEGWEDTLRVSVGFEFRYGALFRVGYMYEQSAIPDEYLQGSFMDSTKQFLSLGASIRMSRRANLQFGYAHGILDTREVTTSIYNDRIQTPSTNEGVLGTYDDSVDLLSFAVIFQLGQQDEEAVDDTDLDDLFIDEDEEDEEEEEDETPDPEIPDDEEDGDEEDGEDDEDDLFED